MLPANNTDSEVTNQNLNQQANQNQNLNQSLNASKNSSSSNAAASNLNDFKLAPMNLNSRLDQEDQEGSVSLSAASGVSSSMVGSVGTAAVPAPESFAARAAQRRKARLGQATGGLNPNGNAMLRSIAEEVPGFGKSQSSASGMSMNNFNKNQNPQSIRGPGLATAQSHSTNLNPVNFPSRTLTAQGPTGSKLNTSQTLGTSIGTLNAKAPINSLRAGSGSSNALRASLRAGNGAGLKGAGGKGLSGGGGLKGSLALGNNAGPHGLNGLNSSTNLGSNLKGNSSGTTSSLTRLTSLSGSSVGPGPRPYSAAVKGLKRSKSISSDNSDGPGMVTKRRR